ncbi:hypothetical protein NW765_000741 [Fusarium oxysporum]|nr:hypothetical protein NW765_000741 [Fusarium oxysporum]KAJ4269093.1 hypothetical protein NW764_014484 [Fusarium oxysporum]
MPRLASFRPRTTGSGLCIESSTRRRFVNCTSGTVAQTIGPGFELTFDLFLFVVRYFPSEAFSSPNNGKLGRQSCASSYPVTLYPAATRVAPQFSDLSRDSRQIFSSHTLRLQILPPSSHL